MTFLDRRSFRVAAALITSSLTLFFIFISGASGHQEQDDQPTAAPTLGPSPTQAGPQGALSQLPIPDGRFLPFVHPCNLESPQFKLSRSVGIVGEQVGWYGLGYRAGSRVSIRVYTALNEDLVEQQIVEVDGWCTFMGTLTLRIPDAYYVVVSGITAKDENSTIMDTVRGVMDLRPPQPTPVRASPPAAPSALRAAAVTADMVRLDWNDNSRDETGFMIEIDGDANGFKVTTPANTTSLTIGTLQPATRHCFTVAAMNDMGQSPRAAACAVTPREGERVPGR